VERIYLVGATNVMMAAGALEAVLTLVVVRTRVGVAGSR